MITFKTVRWKNFLATGNVWTEVILNEHNTTLVMGENGAGKSTFLDALMFGLYGRPFRLINKSQLVNSVNQKGAMVEIEFNTGGHDYLVKRGIKPNKFEIYEDGKLLDQDAFARDYQGMLESAVLKMNQKSATQIVVLGFANYTPFMRLSAADRRKVVEDMLDVEIFSTMNTLLKERVSKNKEDLGNNEHEVRLAETKLSMYQQHLAELQRDREALIAPKREEIEKCRHEQGLASADAEQLAKKLASVEEKLSFEQKTRLKLSDLYTMRAKIVAKQDRLKGEMSMYRTSTDCPTCKQSISEPFKVDCIHHIEEELAEIGAALTKLNAQIEKTDQLVQQFVKLRTVQVDLSTRISRARTQVEQMGKRIVGHEREIAGILNQDGRENEAHSKQLQQEHEDAQKRRTELIADREVLMAASHLLKDGGIKAKIIKQYMPILNKLINRYLEALDFFVQFEINEEFKETIRARYRDEFTYDSFSQGEKLRIDLSLLFAWREVARMRNSMSTNLLVLDEILDSSLDSNGTEDFLQIVKTLAVDTNTFIISHKLDHIEEFDHVIKFAKRDGFSEKVAA